MASLRTKILSALLLMVAMPWTASCSTTNAPSEADVAIERRIDTLLAAMSVEQKVGQIIMPDISAITSADMRRYRFGSILNGGNSGPGGNERAAADAWLSLADDYWDASTAPMADGRPIIPALWATDAVHGHSNVIGATLFPHNVGLGATGNVELMRQIGAATAAEIAVTGIDWTFAPTIAVARDDRWGRTYESYGEDPALVSRLGAAMVQGLQGQEGSDDFLSNRRVLATAKHFFGDGGTGGRDQGDAVGDEAALVALHAAPYPPAIDAGVQTVMASFSSINGRKMHGNGEYLTTLLRGRMGFDGLVVGDWNGHGQLPGCTNSNCPQALAAGLDIYMVPEDWRALHTTLMAQVADGTIPMAQLDQAVRRILRVKLRMGLFDRGRPSARALALQPALLGAPAHRAIARQAVRESLVLLSNRGGLLPLNPRSRILVTGAAADNIAMQNGGWTISWQGGGDLTNADFPGAQSIYAGIAEQVRAAGGQAELSADGSYQQRPNVAVVVFGETPYAEFSGDISGLNYSDERALATMRRLKSQGIAVVALFLSGRPMWVNRELNSADAFVAAWLPGSEGGGVADVLLRRADGGIQQDFRGTLPMSWPMACDQFDNNSGSAGYAPLFRLGYGLRYGQSTQTPPPLSEACALLDRAGQTVTLLRAGLPAANLTILLGAANGSTTTLSGSRGASSDGRLTVQPLDRLAQEDARELRWSGAGAWQLLPGAALSIPTAAAGREWAILLDYAVTARPQGRVQMNCGTACTQSVDLTAELAMAEGKGWRQLAVPLRCLDSVGAAWQRPIQIRSSGAMTMSVTSAQLTTVPARAGCLP